MFTDKDKKSASVYAKNLGDDSMHLNSTDPLRRPIASSNSFTRATEMTRWTPRIAKFFATCVFILLVLSISFCILWVIETGKNKGLTKANEGLKAHNTQLQRELQRIKMALSSADGTDNEEDRNSILENLRITLLNGNGIRNDHNGDTIDGNGHRRNDELVQTNGVDSGANNIPDNLTEIDDAEETEDIFDEETVEENSVLSPANESTTNGKRSPNPIGQHSTNSSQITSVTSEELAEQPAFNSNINPRQRRVFDSVLKELKTKHGVVADHTSENSSTLSPDSNIFD